MAFVGSNTAGEHIYTRANGNGKRVQANMGAKNHTAIMPDANHNQAVNAVVGAAFGAAGQSHDLLEVDPGAQAVVNSFPLPTTPGASPSGPMDMTTETAFPAGGPPQEWVYTLLRTANGALAIDAFNVNTGLFDPLKSRLIGAANVPFATNQRLGLAFDPDGDLGLGSFWITGQTAAPPNTSNTHAVVVWPLVAAGAYFAATSSRLRGAVLAKAANVPSYPVSSGLEEMGHSTLTSRSLKLRVRVLMRTSGRASGEYT